MRSYRGVRNRRGGRLFSDKSKFGYYIDFGGAWIHGKSGNAVYDLAKKANTNLFSFDFDDSEYLSKAIPNPSDEAYYDAGDAFNAFIDSERSAYQEGEDHPLSDIYKDYLESKDFSKEEKCYLDNYVYIEIEDDYGTPIENLSAVTFDETNEKDNENFLLPDGYWNTIVTGKQIGRAHV